MERVDPYADRRQGANRALAAELREPFSQASIQLAADTLEAHRPAFHALVDALLVVGELDAAQVRETWERATAADAG
jgi:hypothetical protein